MPEGRLIASEWACESPTIDSERGKPDVVTVVTGAAVVLGASAAGGTSPDWVSATANSKATSSPPAATSNGSTDT